MRLAVIQHRLRGTAEDDARALAAAVRTAADRGAELIVTPEVVSLGAPGSPERDAFYCLLDDDLPSQFMPFDPQRRGTTYAAPSLDGFEQMGAFALLMGDAAMTPSEWVGLMAVEPAYAILCPRSESDLAAEAMLEVAIALSDSLCGLVIIAECTGAQPGESGHGGSAIIQLGEVLAEALAEDDVLIADVELPIAQPEPREPLPELPTLLRQRLANHEGTKLDLGYLADLGDGPGVR